MDSASLSIEISNDIASRLRKARIAAGLTQAAVAAQSGCKQSAVSMFEAGKRDALSRESIVKIAGLLNIELAQETRNDAPTESARLPYCPGFDCPSNHAYQVGATVFLLPTGTAGNGKHCIFCGEALSGHCHGCGATVRRGGACCQECGTALVVFPEEFTNSVEEWILRHNEIAEKIRQNI